MCVLPVAVLAAMTVLRDFPGTEKQALGRKPDLQQFANYCRLQKKPCLDLSPNQCMLSSVLPQLDPLLFSIKNKRAVTLLGSRRASRAPSLSPGFGYYERSVLT